MGTKKNEGGDHRAPDSQGLEKLVISALKNSPTVVFSQDKNLRYTWVFNPNPEFKLEEVIGKTDADLLPNDEASRLTEIKQGVLKSGMGVREEVKTTIGGKPFFYDLTVEPLRDSENNVVGVNCVSTDITERKKVEKELRLTRLSLDSSNEAIAWIAPDGRFLYVNNASCLALGYTREELLAMRVQDLDPNFPDETWVHHWQQLKNNGKMFFESVHRNKDGKLFPVEISSNYLKHGENEFICSFARDISERKRSMEALRESESKLRLILENIDEIIYVVKIKPDDPFKGAIQYVSNPTERIIGYKPEEFVRNSGLWFELIHPDDVSTVMEDTNRMFASKKPVTRIYRMRHKTTGEYRWFEDRITPQLNDSGEVFSIQGVATDITERKRVEDALKKSERRYQVLSEMTSDYVFRIEVGADRQMKLDWISSGSRSLTGYSAEEIKNPQGWERVVHPDDLFRIQKFLQAILSGKTVEIELRILTKKCDLLWLNVVGKPEWDAERRRVIGILGAGTDITGRKQAEMEMKKKLLKYRLEEGKMYLAKEQLQVKSFEAFNDLIKAGYPGLVISRASEKELKTKIKSDFEFLWLAEGFMGKSRTYKIEELEKRITNLPTKRAVLIDRLDYLIFKNGVKETISMVQRLHEIAYYNNHIIILSVDPSILSKRELRFLEKEAMELELMHARVSPELLEIIRYIYEQDKRGLKTSYNTIHIGLGISKPTVRKRILQLIESGYVVESKRGRSKIVGLTDTGLHLYMK